MTSKFTNLLINTVLPFSILILCLFQLYFQYSSFVTPRNELFNEKDKRDTFISYNLYNKKFGFNLEKIKETFSDNALMRINIVKNYTSWVGKNKGKLKCEPSKQIITFYPEQRYIIDLTELLD